MIILGVDPAFRTCGYFIGEPKTGRLPGFVHKGNGVLQANGIKDWAVGVKTLLGKLEAVCPVPDLVSLEYIVWQGKRKGSLALAHLVGAILGFYVGKGAGVAVYPPALVKARSRGVRIKFPTDHERDAYALAKMAYEDSHE